MGFRPTAVFNVSQTEGEPLLDLETETHAEAYGLVENLLAATDDLGVDATVVVHEE